MGSRFDGETVRGIVVHDDKILADAVSEANSTYTEADPYYLPPVPDEDNSGNLQVHGGGEGSTPQEIRIVRGGTAGSAGFLYRNTTGGTWTGQRPFSRPGPLEYIAVDDTDRAAQEQWQPGLFELPSGEVLLVYHGIAKVLGSIVGSLLPIYKRNTDSSWSIVNTITLDAALEWEPWNAFPQFVQGPGDSVYLFSWRPYVDSDDVTLYLDIRGSTDAFATYSVVKTSALAVEFDTDEFDQIVGFSACATPGGYLIGLYFQFNVDSSTNIVRFWASSDGAATWTELNSLNVGDGGANDTNSGSLELWCNQEGRITCTVVRALEAGTTSESVKIYEKTALYDEFEEIESLGGVVQGQHPESAGCALNDGRSFYSPSEPLLYRGQFPANDSLAGLLEVRWTIDPACTDLWMNLEDSEDYYYRVCSLKNGALVVGIYNDGTDSHVVAIPLGQTETYAPPEVDNDDDAAIVYRGFTEPDTHGWTQTGTFGPNHGTLANGNGYTFDVDGTTSHYEKTLSLDALHTWIVETSVKVNSGTGNILSVLWRSSDLTIQTGLDNVTTTGVRFFGGASPVSVALDMTGTNANTYMFRCVIPLPADGDTEAQVYWFYKKRSQTAWTLGATLTFNAAGGSDIFLIRMGYANTQTAEWVVYQLDYWPTTVTQADYDPEDSQNSFTIATPSGVNYLNDGLVVHGKAGLAYPEDTFSIDSEGRYPLRNIFPLSQPSPSRVWRSTADNATQTITLDLGYDGLYPQTGTFGFLLKSNLKNIKLAWSATPADTSGSLYDSTAHRGPRLYTNTQGIVKRGGLYPSDTSSQYSHFIRAGELKNGWVELSGPKLRNIQANMGGYWIGDGTKAAKAVISMEDVDGTEPTSAGSVTIVTGHLLVLIPGFVPSDTARYLTLHIPAHDTPDGYYEIQQFVAGWFHAFGWSPDASGVTAEEYNSAVYTDPYGRRRYRQLGPKRRAFELSWGDGYVNSGLYQGTQDVSDGEPWRAAALEDEAAGFIRLDPAASVDSLPEAAFSDVYSLLQTTAGGQVPGVLVMDVPNAATATLLEYNLPSRFVYGRLTSNQTREERFNGRHNWVDDAVRAATVRFEEEL